ncbi:MAG: hypothetical protein Q8S13_05105, partial [Dehalococcoidia bacterium]|nr:hypothetical protein [Dehalococcoidia bacterium]
RLPAPLQSLRDNVTVRIKVAPAQGEITLAVAPQVVGLNEALRASIQTSTVTLRLAGELPTLRALLPSAVRVTVNAAGIGEGVHVLEASVSTPEGVRTVAVEPSQVVVVVRR